MRLLAGTSGYSYKEWKGPFYPEKAANADLLRLYAEQLSTVEINNTFYRLPRAEVMQRWASEVPDDFVFVIKASQRITHRARLQGAADTVDYLWKNVGSLGPHLGPILFQLPPHFRKDVPRLRTFLGELPDGLRAVLEFRHESWVDDEVHAVLRDAGAALCAADVAEGEPCGIVATTDWGYLRLRRSDYGPAELRAWAKHIAEQPWREAFVFFKHEEQGAAPRMALQLLDVFGSSP